MKLPGDKDFRKERVKQILSDLDLERCANTQVGNETRKGLSGGERKRTSIATELLMDPEIILLDEPTTGLDSSTALSVIQLLQALVERGKTVCAIVHQPNSQIFKCFDQILLVCRGHIIFQGKAESSMEYFSFLPAIEKLPPNYNPADFFLRIMNPEGMILDDERLAKKENTEELHALFALHLKTMVDHYNKQQRAQVESIVVKKSGLERKVYMSSWLRQFNTIFLRSFLVSFKNPLSFTIRAIQYLFLTLILLSVFFFVIILIKLGDGVNAIQNRRGLLFFISSSNCMLSFNANLQIFLSEKFIFYREKFSKFYGVGSYYLGRTMAEMPYHILYPSLSMIIIFYSVGLNDSSPEKLPIFCLLIYLVIISNATFFAGISFSYLISVASPNLELASLIVPFLFIPFMVLSGFFVNLDSIPYVFYPIAYISIFRYSYQANAIVSSFIQNEFSNLTPPIVCNPSCDALEDQHFQQGMWESLGILFAIGVILRIFAYFLLKKKTDWVVKCPIKPSSMVPTTNAT